MLRLRYGEQMDVIGHQAVGPNLDPFLAAPPGHQLDVSRVVVLAEERLLTSVAALRDVVGQPGDNQPRQSCHAWRLQPFAHFVNTRIVSPDLWFGIWIWDLGLDLVWDLGDLVGFDLDFVDGRDAGEAVVDAARGAVVVAELAAAGVGDAGEPAEAAETPSAASRWINTAFWIYVTKKVVVSAPLAW